MKKLIRSKGFLYSVLVASCIGILATCFLVERNQKSDFQPEEPSADMNTQEMPGVLPPAASAGNRTGTGAPAPAATSGPMEGYPKVVDESGDEVVIDFTPGSGDLKAGTPEPPVAEGDTTDPFAPPTYAPEETELGATASPAQDKTPAPGSTNGKGAVYDPVFGWVMPGQVEQMPAGSDGDPNKMVGSM